jgi:hypothetical protein
MVASLILGSLAGVGIRAVLQVHQRQDHPGPDSVSTGIGEPGGELLDMAAQLGQRLIGEPERAAVQVDLPAAPGLPGLMCRRDVHRGGFQHRSEECGGFLRAGVAAGRLGLRGRVNPLDLLEPSPPGRYERTGDRAGDPG